MVNFLSVALIGFYLFRRRYFDTTLHATIISQSCLPVYSSLASISLLSFLLLIQSAVEYCKEVLYYVPQYLYLGCVSSIAIPLNNLFSPSAGSDVIYYVLHWEFSSYCGEILVGSVFMFAMASTLLILFLVNSIIAADF